MSEFYLVSFGIGAGLVAYGTIQGPSLLARFGRGSASKLGTLQAMQSMALISGSRNVPISGSLILLKKDPRAVNIRVPAKIHPLK